MTDEVKFNPELRLRYSKVRPTVKRSVQSSIQSGSKLKEVRSLRKAAFFAAEEINTKLGRTQKELKAEQERRMEAEEEGRIDHMTQLLNRRGILEKLKEEIQRKRREEIKKPDGERKEPQYFVIFMDVNNLKHVNDNHGHDAGDLLVKEMARILKMNVRPDDVVGRWTQGDEFIVFLEGEDPDDARVFWERVSQEFQHYSNGKNGIDTIWVSAGLAKLDLNNVDKSIDLADRTMQLAKITAKKHEEQTHNKINMLRAEKKLQVPLLRIEH